MRRALRRLARTAAFLAAAYACAGLALVGVGVVDRPGRAALIVVPGNLVHADGRLSGRLESRCVRALRAWRDGLAPRLFVSGGVTPDGRDEAAAMRRWFVARGVPDSAIVVDREGANSWRTARHARRWLREHRARGVVVVTQGFHVPRMRLACARAGIAPVHTLHSRFFELRDFYSIARELPGLVSYAIRPAGRG